MDELIALQQQNVELRQRIAALEKLLATPHKEQRGLYLTMLVEKVGHFNRIDLCKTFSISVPQASLDIAAWLRDHPEKVIYNRSTKRYEAIVRPT